MFLIFSLLILPSSPPCCFLRFLLFSSLLLLLFLLFFQADKESFINPDYEPGKYPETILPVSSMKRLAFWADYYLRYDSLSEDTEMDEEVDEQQPAHNIIVWVPDEHARVCRDCGLGFTVLRRRHHCRACGQVYCADCSKHRMALPHFGYSTQERVCDACFEKLNPERLVSVIGDETDS